MYFIEKYFWVFSTFLVPVLYILAASLFYCWLYLWKKDALQHSKTQTEELTAAQIKRELIYGVVSLIVFASTGFIVYLLYHYGYSQVYLDIWKYGAIYLFISSVLMIFFHDLYFYWTHRMLHLPGWWKKIHHIHHLSSNTSPFTAVSFHPVEAIIQAAVLPLIIVLIPAHPFAIFFFLLYMVYKNVRGHAGYEFTNAANRKNKWNQLHSYAIHHNMHHLHGTGNYGLYFTIWDRLMKTFRKET
jgi:sterol desaturase/sphingolipid hydroxylase (fatty acid hydroxylase superfamily)